MRERKRERERSRWHVYKKAIEVKKGERGQKMQWVKEQNELVEREKSKKKKGKMSGLDLMK